jgi:hypothetical protein
MAGFGLSTYGRFSGVHRGPTGHDRAMGKSRGIVSCNDGQRAERRPNVIDPERRHAGSATHAEGRRVVLLTAPSSHKSIAA